MSPVLAAAVVVLLEGLVLWAVFPIMSYYCAEFGGGPVAVGVMFALLSAPRVICNPLFGWLAERFGRRPLMAVASLGTMAGSILWAVSPDLTWLAVSRAIAGVFGAQAALSATVVADTTPPERRGRAMGVVGAAFGLSMVFGPLLGSEVTTQWSHAAVGWVSAALQGLSVLTVVFVLKETHPARLDPRAPRVPAPTNWQLLRRPRVTPLLLVTFGSALALSQVTTTFAMLGESVYHFAERQAGYAFTVFGLIGTLVQGGVVRVLHPRCGDRRLALAGLACIAGSAVVILAQPPEWTLWLCMGLIGGGVALSTPTIAALLSGSVGPEQQGTVMGLSQGTMSLGRAAGAPLAGWFFAALTPTAPYGLTALVAVLAAALLWPIKDGRGPQPRPVPSNAA
ncbi:MAG TPA: MFS transporter [Phycisphaerae bacterium]|nr:MFS transporter [Phycisphaerae bacterium]